MYRLARTKKPWRCGFPAAAGAAAWVIFVACLSYPNTVQAQMASVRGTVKFHETPLAGVVVTALSTKSKQEKSAVTDAKGAYTIIGLNTENYLFRVGNTPYVVSEGVGGTFHQVQIETAGQTIHDFEMTEGAVITGCAEFPSKSRVVERTVIYEQVNPSSQDFSPMGSRSPTLTDDQGCFRLYGLPAGHYRVGIGKPVGIATGTTSLPFSTTYYPGVRARSEAQVIKVLGGQEYKLERLIIRDNLNSFSVIGSLIDKDSGAKIPNFIFELGRYEGGIVKTVSSLKTDATGDFKIVDLFEGRYRAQPNVKSRDNSANYSCGPLMFEVVDRNLVALNIECTSLAARIKGEVIINDSVFAGNQDCSIALKEGNTLDDSSGRLHRITLDQGRFTLSGLPSGQYTLVIMPLRPSLQYDRAQVGEITIRQPGAFGLQGLNLTGGDQAVKIFLTGR